ncbi:MAG: GNAT family N-acetyltransferase [Colwellia sp.]|nr:GNAT family N-acetyltransferase [Colwellia sp.]
MHSSYKLKTLTNLNEVLALEHEWRVLTEATTETTTSNKTQLSCFMAWEWLSQWLQTYQDFIIELKVICILYNDETIAIAPFYTCINNTWGNTTKTLSLIATNEPEHCEIASEFMDVAYSTKHKQKIIELLTAQLIESVELNRITQYSFKDLHKNSLMFLICQKSKPQMLAYKEQISGYQFVTNIDNHSHYSASFLKKKKRILNRYYKMSNAKNCQFIIANNKTVALKLYEQLVQLHQKRWQKKDKAGVFSDDYFYTFHKNLIKQSIEKGSIVLSAIQIEDQIISVNYSIKRHNTLYFYQSGIDETYKPNLSPGLLNHLLLIDYCEKQHIQQYNLLKSTKKNDYKSQFAQLSDELIDITMLSSTKLNLFWLALYRAKHGLKHLIKLLR